MFYLFILFIFYFILFNFYFICALYLFFQDIRFCDSASSLFYNCIGQQHYGYWILSISISLIKKFYEVTFCRTWCLIAVLIWGKNKSCIKNWWWWIIYRFTGKIFSKQILSWNFKMELWLKRRLLWEFIGWKLII